MSLPLEMASQVIDIQHNYILVHLLAVEKGAYF